MKEKLLDKINKNSFNNKLEEILAQKEFSEDVKNTLLSIFYKIETGYNDYFTVKRDVFDKKEYIEKLIKIIDRDCEKIEFVKPNSQEGIEIKNTGFKIDTSQKEIICYPIDIKILYAIAKMQKRNVVVKYLDKDLEEAISKLLNIGNNMNMVEVLRDFNGFSWNTVIKDIEDINYNLIYQNMLFLVGNKFLDKWVNNYDKMVDYFEIFKSKTKAKIADKICKIAVLLEIKNDEKMKIQIEEKEKALKLEYEKMQNKESYLLELVESKKEIEKQIKNLDKIINSKDLLIKEYEEKNKKLSLEKKIFSIRIFKNILKEERENLLKEIEDINQKMKPKNFLKKQKETKQKLKYFEIANIENITNQINKEKIAIQKDILANMREEIKNVKDKNEIINMLYKYRYYNLLPYDDKSYIFEQKTLKAELNKTDFILITHAINMKTLTQISDSDEINTQIIKKIFTSKIISLEDIYIKITKEKDELYLKIFDEEIQDKKIKLEDISKQELKIKLNKKTKLII